jgi:hypothetical protein
MSAANAAARKRRTTPDPAPSVVNRPSQFSPQSATPSSAPTQPGLTLQQVIAVIDNRLVKLEGFMKDTNKSSGQSDASTLRNKDLEITNNDIMLQEFDKRFEILAEEINNLKDMLLKLQSYTMEVNRTLLEERVQVFSDLGNKEQTNFPADIFDNHISLHDEGSALDLRNLAETELNQ